MKQLYEQSVTIDEKTGLPEDYHSFYAAYFPLIAAVARRKKIPEQDVDDAAQEVAIKFWQKNGLDMYDSDKGRFATLLRNWAGMFLLQERDKVQKNHRFLPYDPTDAAIETVQVSRFESSAEDMVLIEEGIKEWLQAAESAIEAANKPYLMPVLKACVEAAERGTGPSRAEIAAVAECSVSRATTLLKQLRLTLTEYGLGVESLYDQK